MAEPKKLLGEFKDFILQGNVISLAVAVIIATYFGPIVKDVVNLILNILAIPGTKGNSFETLAFHVGGGIANHSREQEALANAAAESTYGAAAIERTGEIEVPAEWNREVNRAGSDSLSAVPGFGPSNAERAGRVGSVRARGRH